MRESYFFMFRRYQNNRKKHLNKQQQAEILFEKTTIFGIKVG